MDQEIYITGARLPGCAAPRRQYLLCAIGERTGVPVMTEVGSKGSLAEPRGIRVSTRAKG